MAYATVSFLHVPRSRERSVPARLVPPRPYGTFSSTLIEGRRYGTSLRGSELRDELPISTGLRITGRRRLRDEPPYGTFQLQDPSQGRTTKGAYRTPGRRRSSPLVYGTLNYGTSSELRDRGLRAEPPYGTSLLAGPYGTLPHRTEAVRGDEPHYRTLHREGRRRGTKALTGRAPLRLPYGTLNNGTEALAGRAFLRDSQLRD